MSALESPVPVDPDAPSSKAPSRPEPRRRGPLGALIALTRPRHWMKNVLVVALPCVAEDRWDLPAVRSVGLGIVLFTIASVCVYVVNDLADRERDRLHPVKRYRPLASGELSARAAGALLAVLFAALVAGVALNSPARLWPVPAYLALNLAYSFRLKHLAIIDAFTVAVGFTLRAMQGYLALRLAPSDWLLLSVFALSLLLVLGKRRRELADSSGAHRPALAGYSVQLLDYMILISASLSVGIYTIHLFAPPPAGLAPAALILITLPCAIFALFRYLQILLVLRGGGDPVRVLLGDRVLLGVGLAWAVLVAVIPLPPTG